MGEVRCQLSEIMGARGSFVRLNLTNSAAPTRAKGIVTIVGEETKDSNANFTVQLACEKLANKVCRMNECWSWIFL